MYDILRRVADDEAGDTSTRNRTHHQNVDVLVLHKSRNAFLGFATQVMYPQASGYTRGTN